MNIFLLDLDHNHNVILMPISLSFWEWNMNIEYWVSKYNVNMIHPISYFLTVGYSTCHWCHVMERESFENTQIAEILNEHFVPIKVDREERPDVDRVYMNFVQVIEIITFVNCLRLCASVGSPNNNTFLQLYRSYSMSGGSI